MMGQCRLTDCNKCTTLVPDRAGGYGVGDRVYGNCILSAQSYYETTKTPLKKSSLFLKKE